VIDNGSGLIKIGFGGDENPKKLIRNFIGRAKHTKVMHETGTNQDYFVGDYAEQHRGILKLSYPMEHGVVTDWEAMENIWDYCYKQLQVDKEEHPVLLTEAALNPTENRLKAAQIFFEKFEAPYFYCVIQAVLGLYASLKTTGTVLDCGDGVTHAVPIYNGYAIMNAVTRMDLAGRDITRYLQLLLRLRGYNMDTSSELEMVRSLKESDSIMYVAASYSKEEELFKRGAVTEEKAFTLPDGSTISIGPERFRATEVLFKPDIIGLEYQGVHELLYNSIQKTDRDIRQHMYSDIVLSGGSTMFSKFPDRILSELHQMTKERTRIKLFAPQNRKNSVWIGGSILASLSTFKDMWITKQQFHEFGANIILRNTF